MATRDTDSMGGLPVRLDRALLLRGLVRSRTRAQEVIRTQGVLVDGKCVHKPDLLVGPGAQILLPATEVEWVSRGAYKLVAALEQFGISVADQVCIDVGCSTGGFTQVLLRRGARVVHAVDVGTAQFAPELRGDPRVHLREGTDIRSLTPEDLLEPPQVCVIDVSFIGLEKVLPAILPLLAPQATIVCLVKPQFEVGPGKTRKGVVQDEDLRSAVVDRMTAFVEEQGLVVSGVIPSPILGGSGNTEYLLVAKRGDHSV